MPPQSKKAQFTLLFIPSLVGEKTDSCLSRGYLCESERNELNRNSNTALRFLFQSLLTFEQRGSFNEKKKMKLRTIKRELKFMVQIMRKKGLENLTLAGHTGRGKSRVT